MKYPQNRTKKAYVTMPDKSCCELAEEIRRDPKQRAKLESMKR